MTDTAELIARQQWAICVEFNNRDGYTGIRRWTRLPADAVKWMQEPNAGRFEMFYDADALSSLVRERDEARAEVARYWTSGDITPWVTLAEEKGLGHFGKKLKGMFNRAISAEDRAEAAEANAARMREALKPFARVADMEERAEPFASVMVNVDRCRDARALLLSLKDNANG